MATLPTRPFGNTGMEVTLLGLGTAEIGGLFHEVPEAQAQHLLNQALDLGINLIDTARSYGHAEERIGKFLSQRRGDFILSSKCGTAVAEVADWTGKAVAEGINDSLRRMRTEWIDIMFLHSCSKEVLERGDVIDALDGAHRAGKIRVAGYSGDNEALGFAISTGRFQAIEVSVNICDQRAIDSYLLQAQERSMGIIAKRPLANAPWRYASRPVGEYVEPYWERFQAMQLDPEGLDWDELALRFSVYAPWVDTCITGTANEQHLRRNIEILLKGPLADQTVHRIRDTFRQHDQGWVGQI